MVELGPWAAPFAGAYGLGVLARRWAYDHGLYAQETPAIPCISVGGLEVGGTGKTPIARWLLSALQQRGLRPGLLSRGYGRRSRGLILRRQGEALPVEVMGDEPAFLAQGGCDVPMALCADRLRGAEALAQLGCRVAVMDDGFVHRRLRRALDIVVLRAEAPLGVHRHLMPWGGLREPVSSLRRVHVLWLHARSGAPQETPGWVAKYAPNALLVHSVAQVARVQTFGGADVPLDGARVVLAAGIANPAAYQELLEARGAWVGGRFWFKDHHRFSPRDVKALEQERVACGADWVVVTAKDAVKLRVLDVPERFAWVDMDVRVVEGESGVLERCVQLLTANC